jgi:hypothetical protein
MSLKSISQAIYNRVFSSEEVGSIVEATIISIEEDRVVLDAKDDGEAIIARSEFANELIEVGFIVSLCRETPNPHDDLVQWSRIKARRIDSWRKLESFRDEGRAVEGTVNRTVKGGFNVELNGLEGFLPASEADIRAIDDPTVFLDTRHLFEITKMRRKDYSVVVSRRRFLKKAPSEIEQIDLWKPRLSKAVSPQSYLALSDKLVELVYQGLLTHFDIVQEGAGFTHGVPEPTRDRAASMLVPRVLEIIAAKAHRIRAGSVKNKPLIASGKFDYEFVFELKENLPFRIDDSTPFFETLRDDIIEWLSKGNPIAGEWGHLSLDTGRVLFDIAPPKPISETDWEKPQRYHVR